MNLDDSLLDKNVTNGAFEDAAQLSQAIKFLLRRGKNWESLPPPAREALELIATSISRVLSGDPAEAHHWNSIAECARIRGKALESVESGIQRLARVRAEMRIVTPNEVERLNDEHA